MCTEFTDGDCPGSTLSFVASELVGRPTDHSITINAMAGQATAGQAVEAYVEYGLISDNYTGNTIAATYADGIIETVIDGLAPDTQYYYRLRYRPSGSLAPFQARSEYTFHTQRDIDSTFTFAVQSDSHQGFASFHNDALYRTTMTNIRDAEPDFLIDLGDTVSTDDATETQASVRTKYLNQRTIFDIAGNSTPVFLALGNHENEEGWNLDDFGQDSDVANSLPVLGANARKRFFLNPAPDDFYSGNLDQKSTIFGYPAVDGDGLLEDYYAFEWGDALFVIIDPYWYTMKKPYSGTTGGEKNDETTIGTRWDWTLGAAQYDWLKETLESNTARFKFVFAHHHTGGTDDYVRAGAFGAKYCEWGGYDLDGRTWAFNTYRPGWAMPIHQLFVSTGVTAFFHGHDHIFAAETLDGVVYQELPHAANAGYGGGFSDNPTYYPDPAVRINNSGYLRVTVSSSGAAVEYVRSVLPADESTLGIRNRDVSYTYTMIPCDARDGDHDGTNDCLDHCPLDSQKTEPGICGCGKSDGDSDGDGAIDCFDGCPSDPSKTAPGICGCGVVEDPMCVRYTFMAVRVGTGSAALTNVSTAAFIEEHSLADGALVDTIPLPIEALGINKPLTLAGAALREGTLRRSVDGKYLTMAGYAAAPGATTNVHQSASTTTNRVAALISRAPTGGYTIDTSTSFSGPFNGASGTPGNPRAAVSYDGTGFWVVGGGTGTTGGMWYAPLGATVTTTTGGTQIFSATSTGTYGVWTCGIFNDQLYGTANTQTPLLLGLYQTDTALPIIAATPIQFIGNSGSSPLDFAVLDLDPDIAGVDTVYLSDERTAATGGGIQKWVNRGSGWTLDYTLGAGLTTGIRHFVAVDSPDGVMLIGATVPASTSTQNTIVRFIDTGVTSGATTFAVAPTNTAYRGIALSPLPPTP
jgi:hypothetical protein